jgi:hypothetical protein
MHKEMNKADVGIKIKANTEIFGYEEPYQAGYDLRQNFNLHWEALLEFRR